MLPGRYICHLILTTICGHKNKQDPQPVRASQRVLIQVQTRAVAEDLGARLRPQLATLSRKGTVDGVGPGPKPQPQQSEDLESSTEKGVNHSSVLRPEQQRLARFPQSDP